MRAFRVAFHLCGALWACCKILWMLPKVIPALWHVHRVTKRNQELLAVEMAKNDVDSFPA